MNVPKKLPPKLKRYRKPLLLLLAAILLVVFLVNIKNVAKASVNVYEGQIKVLSGLKTKVTELLKQNFGAAEEETPAPTISVYEIFRDEIRNSESYKVTGTKQELSNIGEVTAIFDYEMSVNGGNYAVKETNEDFERRIIQNEKELYQIDDRGKTMKKLSFENASENIIRDAVGGNIVANSDTTFDDIPVKYVEIYQTGKIYQLLIDYSGQLKKITLEEDQQRTEYIITRLELGAFSAADMKIPEDYQLSAASELETADNTEELKLPEEYPGDQLPLPESAELYTVRKNLDGENKGNISVVYFARQPVAELQQYYEELLNGTENYGMLEESNENGQLIYITGTAGNYEVQYVQIQWDSDRDSAKVELNIRRK